MGKTLIVQPIKEVRLRTAHGEYMRVKWTPTGLESQYMTEGSETECPGGVEQWTERCSRTEMCECPRKKIVKPDWFVVDENLPVGRVVGE